MHSPQTLSTRSTTISSLVLTAAMAVVCILLTVTPARGVEVLSAAELASHCAQMETDPEGVDGQYCIRYIQGFIDGAVATDARVMLSAESKVEKAETFSERAMRTRAPNRTERVRAARLAGFCLGDPLPLRDVVEVVVADLSALAPAAGSASDPAMEVVYASLRAHFPCSQ